MLVDEAIRELFLSYIHHTGVFAVLPGAKASIIVIYSSSLTSSRPLSSQSYQHGTTLHREVWQSDLLFGLDQPPRGGIQWRADFNTIDSDTYPNNQIMIKFTVKSATAAQILRA